ncbi:MAG: coproporphyrinogen dehydrogenase HemZ [Saccharofermentanales bacterium]
MILSGHDFIYPISDVLKMFFGSFHAEDHVVTAGNSEDPVIISSYDGTKIQTSYSTGSGSRIWQSGTGNLPPKREVKRQLYLALSELTGRHFPWGSLTGIRPTLVAAECGYDPEILESMYYVSEAKAKIAVETAINENKLLEGIAEDSVQLFIGIPFCMTRCEYCSFPMAEYGKIKALVPSYIDTLISELDTFVPALSGRLGSIYIGGGTPTSMPPELFSRLIARTGQLCRDIGNVEFTVEAGRPDSITYQNLHEMKDAGVNRLCINPQTFNEKTLAGIGRKHSVQAIYEAVDMAGRIGFETINMDLIAGLQGETFEDFRHSLEETISLSPGNITIHSLSLKRTSDLKRKLSLYPGVDVFDEFSKIGTDISRMLDHSYHTLETKGYKPYYMYRQKDTLGGHENIGYTTEGHPCIYNVVMMSDRHTIFGAGAKAMSKRVYPEGKGVRIERFPDPADINTYIKNRDEIFKKKRDFFDGLI